MITPTLDDYDPQPSGLVLSGAAAYWFLTEVTCG